MVGRIGDFQIGGGYSNESAADYTLNQLKPRTALVVNEEKQAAILLSGVPRVIFRSKGEGFWDDDRWFTSNDPEHTAVEMDRRAPKGCYLYVGNEWGSQKLEQQDDWTYAFVMKAKSLNRKCSVHNNAVQHPLGGRSDIRKLRRSTLAAIDAGGFVGTHFYYFPDLITESNRRDSSGRLWNAFTVIDAWIAELGNIPMVFTEFGMAWNYDPHDGQFNHISENVFFQHTRQIAEHYPEIDILPYARVRPGTEWEPFNWMNKETYKSNIAQWNRSNPVSQFPKPNLAPYHDATVTAAANVGSNVRNAADTRSALTRTVKVGDKIRISAKSHPNQGYNWHQLEQGDYIAHGNGASFDFSPKTAPSPGGEITQEQWNRINNANQTIKTASEQIDLVLKEINPPSGGGGF